jgi:hypothetical protein
MAALAVLNKCCVFKGGDKSILFVNFRSPARRVLNEKKLGYAVKKKFFKKN